MEKEKIKKILFPEKDKNGLRFRYAFKEPLRQLVIKAVERGKIIERNKQDGDYSDLFADANDLFHQIQETIEESKLK